MSRLETKENKERLLDILNNHFEHFQDCVKYLINGDYSEQHYRQFKDIVKSNRANKKAWIFNHLAVAEYGLTLQQACRIWNGVSDELKSKINDYLDYRIKVAVEDLELE